MFSALPKFRHAPLFFPRNDVRGQERGLVTAQIWEVLSIGRAAKELIFFNQSEKQPKSG